MLSDLSGLSTVLSSIQPQKVGRQKEEVTAASSSSCCGPGSEADRHQTPRQPQRSVKIFLEVLSSFATFQNRGGGLCPISLCCHVFSTFVTVTEVKSNCILRDFRGKLEKPLCLSNAGTNEQKVELKMPLFFFFFLTVWEDSSFLKQKGVPGSFSLLSKVQFPQSLVQRGLLPSQLQNRGIKRFRGLKKAALSAHLKVISEVPFPLFFSGLKNIQFLSYLSNLMCLCAQLPWQAGQRGLL